MSLKTFVELPAIRHAIDTAIHFPRLAGEFQMRVEPRSRRFSLIGTAYDYLLRFMLERANAGRVSTRSWVAEGAVQTFLLNHGALVIHAADENSSIDMDSSLMALSQPARATAARIQALLDGARDRHRRYLSGNVLDDALIRSAVALAKLDVLRRVGRLPDDFDQVHDDDVEELRQLIQITPIEQFIADASCVLNPTFGEASTLVGGADGDLLIDGNLIDIKTTIAMPQQKNHQRQLAGYLVLASIGGVDGESDSTSEIRGIGFYASRFGQLITYTLEEVVDVDSLPYLMEVFRETASNSRMRSSKR